MGQEGAVSETVLSSGVPFPVAPLDLWVQEATSPHQTHSIGGDASQETLREEAYGIFKSPTLGSGGSGPG